MGRYRKPQPRGSRYITVEGEAALREELRFLWKDERPKITAIVSEAAKQGDRSENGDYIYGKRRLAEIDRRVRYLTKRLDELTVVSELPADRDKVFFGAWVELEDAKGLQHCYRIVGPDEFSIREGKLSMDSPLAKALLGKGLDADVSLSIAGVNQHYIITDIRYKPL